MDAMLSFQPNHLFKRLLLVLVCMGGGDTNLLYAKDDNPQIQIQDAQTKEIQTQETSIQETSIQETSIQETSIQETPIQETQELQTKKKPYSWFYGLDFSFYLDNTEKMADFDSTRTLFALNITPEVGLNFYQQNIRLGLHLIAFMGEQYPNQWGLNISYDFFKNGFAGFFGIFSKKYEIGKYPLMFFSKDYRFFHPTNSGIMLQYSSSKDQTMRFDAEVVLDWYGSQKDNLGNFDEFLTKGFFEGDFLQRKIFLGSSFLIYHTKNDVLLNPNTPPPYDVYLLDRFFYEIFVGSDWLSLAPMMQTLEAKLSFLGSAERKRRLSSGTDPYLQNIGGQFSFNVAYKGFGLDNQLYFGNPQFSYFQEYKRSVYEGVPFYHSKLYNRTEAYYEYKNEYLRTRFSLILHATPGNLAHQEMLTLSIDTEKLLSKIL